jgi:hypothetical protein
MALEPDFRRFWPRCLISWARLSSGKFRDPLVARDLLAGSMIGALVGALNYVETFLPYCFNLRGITPTQVNLGLLSDPGHFTGALVSLLQHAVLRCIACSSLSGATVSDPSSRKKELASHHSYRVYNDCGFIDPREYSGGPAYNGCADHSLDIYPDAIRADSAVNCIVSKSSDRRRTAHAENRRLVCGEIRTDISVHSIRRSLWVSSIAVASTSGEKLARTTGGVHIPSRPVLTPHGGLTLLFSPR